MAPLNIKVGAEELIRQIFQSARNRPAWRERQKRKKILREQLEATPYDEPWVELGRLAEAIGRPGRGLGETRNLLIVIGARADVSRPAATPEGARWALRSRIRLMERRAAGEWVD
jgi:hypothetical protein